MDPKSDQRQRVNAVRALVSESASNIVSLKPRRHQGRPRKPPQVERPCTDSFETVATAIVGIAHQPALWNAAKERVRRWADRDKPLRPISTKVVGFLMEHMNKKKGYDWHGARTIADALGETVRSVENAFRQLSKGGYVLREPVVTTGRGKETRPWRTTVPALVAAAREVANEREEKARLRLALPNVRVGPEQKTCVDPNKKGNGPEQKRQDGPEQVFGQILKEESKKESAGSAPHASHDYSPMQPEGPRPAPEIGAVGPKKAANGQIGAQSLTTNNIGSAKELVIPQLRPSPRFDRTLPMDQRLHIPGGRYGLPETTDDQQLLKKLRRAARGWDLHEARAKYASWATSAQTPDAVAGFISWLWSHYPTAAPNYQP